MTSPSVSPSAGSSQGWFSYPIRVQPHHTDYGGIVWHGTYITWLEAARVEALAAVGIEFADLVAMGVDLPVVDLSLRYHRSLRLGDRAIVYARLLPTKGVRLVWDYAIEPPDNRPPHGGENTAGNKAGPVSVTKGGSDRCYVTGQVTLAAIDPKRGKVLRRYPPIFTEALEKLRA
ncbi:MAG: thioesterase family protein [Cyanobacteria bacterium P01_F01_bin.153]